MKICDKVSELQGRRAKSRCNYPLCTVNYLLFLSVFPRIRVQKNL